MSVISAHDGWRGVANVLWAKEETLDLLRSCREGMPREEYHGWYGQILDVEDTGALRRLYQAIRRRRGQCTTARSDSTT